MSKTKITWAEGHSNAWPPQAAAPLTASFRIEGKVVKTYPLEVALQEQKDAVSAKITKEAKASGPKIANFTAVTMKVSSIIRLPADGDDDPERTIKEEELRKNMNAFVEYWHGYEGAKKLESGKRNVPHLWTGENEFTFWVTPEVMKTHTGDIKAGETLQFVTECSTVCVRVWGDGAKAGAAAKAGIKLNHSALAQIQAMAAKSAAEENDGWED